VQGGDHVPVGQAHRGAGGFGVELAEAALDAVDHGVTDEVHVLDVDALVAEVADCLGGGGE
jgi:hypothetical protein